MASLGEARVVTGDALRLFEGAPHRIVGLLVTFAI
jgi:hypothetical protein